MLILKIILISTLAMSGSGFNCRNRSLEYFGCNEELNEQIALYFQISQFYLSLSVHYGSNEISLSGFSKFFKESWLKKLKIAEKLINYASKRGAKIEIPSTEKLNTTLWCQTNICQNLEQISKLENKNDDQLHKLAKCATFKNNTQFASIIERKFMRDQFKISTYLENLLTKIERNTLEFAANGTRISTCDGYKLSLVD
ncbi:unnamed protein product [Brachionus calyciflorus]|uniref:Ferritin n=1 Tax=Brachionus calyciflorus TaxID=104777 RepID=A0A814DGI0_9BILA|nr:unnamed protein product [Brachionus calyciflorus]